MKSQSYKFLIPILISLFLFSCKTSSHNQKKVKESENYIFDNALLWKVEGQGLKYPSYIFGTIHLIKDEDFFLPAGFSNAFDQVQEIVFEIDMKQTEDMSLMMKILPKLMMKGDTTLKDLLTDEDYAILQKRLSKSGIPPFLTDKIKPMFLSMLGDSDINFASMQEGKYKSYEMELLQMAKAKNKTTGGLETIEYQISVMDSIPYKEQAKMLMEEIKDSENKESQTQDLIEKYKKQDIQALYSGIHSDEISKYEKILLYNRNKNWIPLMIKFMNEKPVMFAVGAGHLAGKNGILMLLKKKGYKLIPILTK